MSIDAAPKLTKEEKEAKRLRKEAKKAKKAAAAAEEGTSTVPTTAAVSEASTPAPAAAGGVTDEKAEKKKRKEEKKRKRAEEAAGESSTVTPAEPTESTDRPDKKSKKDKKAAAADVPAASSSTGTGIVQPSAFNSSHDAYLTSQNVTLEPRLFPPFLSIPSLPVHPTILSWLGKFKSPTPIQSCSWPALLGGRDVIAIAETGSGKTLGFGVPGLHLLSSLSASASGWAATGGEEGLSKKQQKKAKKAASAGGSTIQMLVLAPTRELALQSHETLNELGGAMGIKSVCLYGGVGKAEQLRDLARDGNRIVVGTPGRILDLADSGDMDLSNVKYLVLDEADRMLDQGFENDIRRIIAHTPKETRQTVMFSATWPESVRRLASTFLTDPIRITVGSDELSANKRIEQIVEVLDNFRDKDHRMLHHLRSHLQAHPNTPTQPTRILVFALYKKEAERLQHTIQRARFSVAGLHGDMGQAERFKALDSFKRGDVNVLVATDVAARGLDIPDVGLVLNVTFPLTTEDFVHRCGRTGRAGKSGKAVTFFTGENHEKSLAGEFMRVLRDAGAEVPKEMDRFPSTIKKKEHGSYGAWFKDTANAPPPTKITFD